MCYNHHNSLTLTSNKLHFSYKLIYMYTCYHTLLCSMEYYITTSAATIIVHGCRDIKLFKAVTGEGECFLNTNMINLRIEEGVSNIHIKIHRTYTLAPYYYSYHSGTCLQHLKNELFIIIVATTIIILNMVPAVVHICIIRTRY